MKLSPAPAQDDLLGRVGREACQWSASRRFPVVVVGDAPVVMGEPSAQWWPCLRATGTSFMGLVVDSAEDLYARVTPFCTTSETPWAIILRRSVVLRVRVLADGGRGAATHGGRHERQAFD